MVLWNRLSPLWKNVLSAVFVAAVLGGGYLLVSSQGILGLVHYPEVDELAKVSSSWSFQKYSDYLQKLSEDKGAPYAYEVMKRAQFASNVDLHLLAHTVGDMLYKQQGINGIKVCTPDFRNACSHSIVIGVLRDQGVTALPEIAATCKEAPGGKGAYTMCFHGLGHGVLAFNDYEFEKAIDMCKKTGTAEYKNREYVECVGGATMEMIAGVHDRAQWEKQSPKYFKKNDPLYPCDASFMPAETHAICYTYLTPHLFTSAGMSLGKMDTTMFGKAFVFCSVLPEGSSDRAACYGGFGKEFPVIAAGRDVRNIGLMAEEKLRNMRSWCEQAKDASGVAQCNSNVLSSLFWGGENVPDAALTYCAIATGEAQAGCYTQLAGAIAYYDRGTSRLSTLCSRLPAENQPTCMRPAGKP